MVDLTLARDLGHTVVVVGIDPAAGTLTVLDPDMPSPGRRLLDYEEFAAMWSEEAYGGDFRAMILT